MAIQNTDELQGDPKDTGELQQGFVVFLRPCKDRLFSQRLPLSYVIFDALWYYKDLKSHYIVTSETCSYPVYTYTMRWFVYC